MSSSEHVDTTAAFVETVKMDQQGEWTLDTAFSLDWHTVYLPFSLIALTVEVPATSSNPNSNLEVSWIEWIHHNANVMEAFSDSLKMQQLNLSSTVATWTGTQLVLTPIEHKYRRTDTNRIPHMCDIMPPNPTWLSTCQKERKRRAKTKYPHGLINWSHRHDGFCHFAPEHQWPGVLCTCWLTYKTSLPLQPFI